MSELDYLLYADYVLRILSFIATLCILYGAYLINSQTELPGRKLLFYAAVIALIYYLLDNSFDYISWPTFMEDAYFGSKAIVNGTVIFMFGFGFLKLCLHLARNKIIINPKHE
jgi:hypothetical protein